MEKANCEVNDGPEIMKNIISRDQPQRVVTYKTEQEKINNGNISVSGDARAKIAFTPLFLYKLPRSFPTFYTELDEAWMQEEEQKIGTVNTAFPRLIFLENSKVCM